MKHSHKIFISIIVLVLAIVNACEYTDFEYSCDPIIDEYVKNNKKALSDISIDKLLSYDVGLQRAIFSSWDYRKKHDIWIEKLYLILENENLTCLEENHIIELINHISENYFLPESFTENQNTNSIFSQYWIEYAQSDLGWTDKYIALIVYRLYTNEEQLIKELSSINELRTNVLTDNEGEYSCNCNSSADFCGIMNCGAGICNITSGCGWLWSQECNGICY